MAEEADALIHQISLLDIVDLQLLTRRFTGYAGDVQDLMTRKDFAGKKDSLILGVRNEILDTFSSLEKLTMAFRDSRDDVSVVNLNELLSWYKLVDSFDNGITFVNAVDTLFDQIQHKLQTVDKKNSLAILCILYLPVLQEPETSLIILPKACNIIANFSTPERFEFALIVQESIQATAKEGTEKNNLFKLLIQLFQQYLSLIIPQSPSNGEQTHEDIVWAVQTLSILSAVNETNNFVPFYEFYNEMVEEVLDLKDDYPRWKSSQG